MTAPGATAPQVFISYRRQETAGHAGRLYDAMSARFGEPHVFVDVDLAPGIDFVERITEAVGSCHVLLVVMGPQWATVPDDHGLPRIADPDDYVRLEVETALGRPDVTVIPVLVAGAEMPDPDDLPEGVRGLARRNALELSDMRWRYDVGRLNATLDQLLADTPAAQQIPTPTPTETPTPDPGTPTPAPAARPGPAPSAPEPATRMSSTARLFIDGMLIAGAAALIARVAVEPINSAETTSDAGAIGTEILWRTITWAVLGAALAVWLTLVRGQPRLVVPRMLLGVGLGAIAGALGGAIIALPDTLSDLSEDTIRAISIGSFAVSGGVIGALLGGLWVPRKVGTGLLAGLAAGALVRLFWNAVDWSGGSTIQESLGLGI
jgi:hypothetical protein